MTITVTQFTDLHFSRPGNRSHGGFGYDTDDAWATASADAFRQPTDLTVLTGDLADHGEPDEYLVAAERLAAIPNPANIVPGNHDFHLPLQAALPRPGLTMDRSQRIGNWLFVFADSNGEGREIDKTTGQLVDTSDRIETNGLLGPAEVAWIDDLITNADADHVWLWMHHPPAIPGHFNQPAFDAEVSDLIDRHPHIKGIGAGHVHTDAVVSINNRPIYVAPALTISFDLDAWTTLPPGYRTYAFEPDGTVTSVCHLMDDDRWPRFPLPEPVIDYFKGKGTWDELMAALS